MPYLASSGMQCCTLVSALACGNVCILHAYKSIRLPMTMRQIPHEHDYSIEFAEQVASADN